LALDEPKDTDERLTIDGFAYIVDKDLFAMVQPITIDFTPMGFQVTGSVNTANRTGGCATCG
jgi:hypothetical protein